MISWAKYGPRIEMIKLLFNVVTNVSNDVLNNARPDVQKVHNNRFHKCFGGKYFAHFF